MYSTTSYETMLLSNFFYDTMWYYILWSDFNRFKGISDTEYCTLPQHNIITVISIKMNYLYVDITVIILGWGKVQYSVSDITLNLLKSLHRILYDIVS